MKSSLFKTISTILLIFCTQNVFASTWGSGDVNLLKLSIKCSSNANGDKPWNSSITAVATEFTIQGNRFWSGSGKHAGDTGQHIFTGYKTDQSLTITAIGKWLLKSNTWDLYFVSRGNKTMHQHLIDGIPGFDGSGKYRRDCEIKLLNSIPVASALNIEFKNKQISILKNQVSKLQNGELNIQAETMKLSRQYDRKIANLKKEISDSKNNLEFETKFNEINKEYEDIKNELARVQQEKSSLESKNLKLETNYQDLESKHEKVQQEKSSLDSKNKDLNQELNIFKKKEVIEIKRKEDKEKEKLLLIKQNKERVKEEDRKREERKINNLKYELISSEIVVAQNFIRDLEEFVKLNPSEFDIVEIAELLIENRQILDDTWNELTANSFTKLKDYLKNSESFNQFYNQKELDRYNKKLSELDQEYELLISSQKELESKLNENLTSEFAPLIVEKIKSIRIVLKDYTLKSLINTNLEIDAFKENLSKQINGERLEEENKITEIDKINKDLLKLKELLSENLTNDNAPLIIKKINYLINLNSQIYDSKGLRKVNLNTEEFIDKLKTKPLTDNAQSRNNTTNIKIESKTSNDKVLIPAFEKLVREGRTRVEMGEIFYGCIERIDYTKKDVFTDKNRLLFIYLKGAKYSGVYKNATVMVEEFMDLSEDDPNSPKIGECFAFKPSFFPMDISGGGLTLVNGEFDIDVSSNFPVLKDKLTVTEFFEDRLDYGSKIIEITGKVAGTSNSNRSFNIELFSEKFSGNDDRINSYYNSEKWVNDETIKMHLQSIREGDLITVKGYFGGTTPILPPINGFEVISIKSINNKSLIADEIQKTLVLDSEESNKDLISQIETFYVDSCNQDLEILEDNIEISTAMCKCIFNSIMDAGLSKEELFGTNGMYEVYQARAKGTNEGFTDIESKIVDIQMDSVGNCMLETNYFNYLYDLPIKE
jgi:hypothetical protein